MANDRQIIVRQAGNGFVVVVPGKVFTREVASLFGTATREEREEHLYVFTNVIDMAVFMHHLFNPTTEARVGIGAEPKTDSVDALIRAYSAKINSFSFPTCFSAPASLLDDDSEDDE